MANRLPVEAALVEACEDLLDEFDAYAVDGLTPQEIKRFRRQLQRHLTQTDAYAYERQLLRTAERCGFRSVRLQRELARLWKSGSPEEMEVPAALTPAVTR